MRQLQIRASQVKAALFDLVGHDELVGRVAIQPGEDLRSARDYARDLVQRRFVVSVAAGARMKQRASGLAQPQETVLLAELHQDRGERSRAPLAALETN